MTAAEVFRDYEMPGVPESGPHRPNKREIRTLLGFLETVSNVGAGLAYASLSLIHADLAHAANTFAIVYNDATPANNGMYVKVGASGTGSWTRAGDLPTSLVRLNVTGGTGNAIVATAPETPSMPGAKLYILAPTANNSGDAYITVNGGASVQIKNALGSQLAANSLLLGSPVLMAWQTDHYQLLVSLPVDATGILNDAIAARDAANGYATNAAASASAIGNQVHQYDTCALASAANIPSGVNLIQLFGRSAVGDCPPFQMIKMGSAPSPVREWHLQNAADLSWWSVVPSVRHSFEQFGTNGGTTANNLSAIQAANDFLALNGGGTVYGRPGRQYRVTSMPAIDPTVRFEMQGGSIILDALTLTTIGDSITAGSGASDFNGTISPAKGFAPLLAAHYGWTLNNTGHSGDAASDQGNESFSVAPARGSVSTLFLGTNDKILNASDHLNREINTASGHLAELLQLGIKQDVNKVRGQSMTVLAGSWANLTSGTDPNGVYSSTNGSVLEAVVRGRHVVLVGWWNAFQSGQFVVSIDLKVVGAFNATPFGAETLGNGGVEYGPFALVFSDLPKGEHRVRVAVTSATDPAKVVRISFVAGLDGVVDHTNPLVAVGNLHDFTDAANTTQGVTYGRNGRLNNLIASNIAICQKLGLNVVPVEIYDTINAATDCPLDGIHPNDAGHVKLKDAFVAAIDGAWSSYRDTNPSEFAKAAFLAFRGHPYADGQSLTMQEWRYRPF
nr:MULTISPECIES: SGNH/GDSL hydrolase family protein [unclassified Bradyrhizobium]